MSTPVNEIVLTEAVILEALRHVIDPEVGCSVVDLGLIYSVAIDGSRVHIVMTVTTPGCPMHDSLQWGVQNVVLDVPGVTDVSVELSFDPPWNPSMMTEAGRAITGTRF